jgi:hypothetical protein
MYGLTASLSVTDTIKDDLQLSITFLHYVKSTITDVRRHTTIRLRHASEFIQAVYPLLGYIHIQDRCKEEFP